MPMLAPMSTIGIGGADAKAGAIVAAMREDFVDDEPRGGLLLRRGEIERGAVAERDLEIGCCCRLDHRT